METLRNCLFDSPPVFGKTANQQKLEKMEMDRRAEEYEDSMTAIKEPAMIELARSLIDKQFFVEHHPRIQLVLPFRADLANNYNHRYFSTVWCAVPVAQAPDRLSPGRVDSAGRSRTFVFVGISARWYTPFKRKLCWMSTYTSPEPNEAYSREFWYQLALSGLLRTAPLSLNAILANIVTRPATAPVRESKLVRFIPPFHEDHFVDLEPSPSQLLGKTDRPLCPTCGQLADPADEHHANARLWTALGPACRYQTIHTYRCRECEERFVDTGACARDRILLVDEFTTTLATWAFLYREIGVRFLASFDVTFTELAKAISVRLSTSGTDTISTSITGDFLSQCLWAWTESFNLDQLLPPDLPHRDFISSCQNRLGAPLCRSCALWLTSSEHQPPPPREDQEAVSSEDVLLTLELEEFSLQLLRRVYRFTLASMLDRFGPLDSLESFQFAAAQMQALREDKCTLTQYTDFLSSLEQELEDRPELRERVVALRSVLSTKGPDKQRVPLIFDGIAMKSPLNTYEFCGSPFTRGGALNSGPEWVNSASLGFKERCVLPTKHEQQVLKDMLFMRPSEAGNSKQQASATRSAPTDTKTLWSSWHPSRNSGRLLKAAVEPLLCFAPFGGTESALPRPLARFLHGFAHLSDTAGLCDGHSSCSLVHFQDLRSFCEAVSALRDGTPFPRALPLSHLNFFQAIAANKDAVGRWVAFLNSFVELLEEIYAQGPSQGTSPLDPDTAANLSSREVGGAFFLPLKHQQASAYGSFVVSEKKRTWIVPEDGERCRPTLHHRLETFLAGRNNSAATMRSGGVMLC